MRSLRGMIIRVVFTVGCQHMPDYSEQFPCYGHLHLHFVLLSDHGLVVVEIVVERALGPGRAPCTFYHGLPDELVPMDNTP